MRVENEDKEEAEGIGQIFIIDPAPLVYRLSAC